MILLHLRIRFGLQPYRRISPHRRSQCWSVDGEGRTKWHRDAMCERDLCASVALMLMLTMTCSHGVDAQQRALDASALLARTPTPAMHIVIGEAVLFDVRMHADFVAPKAQAKRWQFVVAGPALIDGQKTMSVSLAPEGKRATDLSAWKRPLFVSEIPASAIQPTRAAATWQARVELRSRTLADGPGASAVPALPVAQRAAALAATELLDWTSESFQSGIDRAGLRPREGEHRIAFARRVLRHVRGLKYAYTTEMDRCASHVLAGGASDCGGLGGLTVATLRAAGIPARLLVGRWAKSTDPADRLEGLPYGQWHVKAEFYLDDIGWIPVDAAVGMNDVNAWFGEQKADFIVMHLDPGVRVQTLFGERELIWAQSLAFWLRGDGTLDGLTVDETWVVTPLRP